MIEFVLKV